MHGPKTGGAYDWDLDYASPSMPRAYVLLVDWRVAVAVTTRLVWVFEMGRGGRLRLRLRLLRCLPKRPTAVAHRRAEFLRPSPSVPARGLRCVGREAGWGGNGTGGVRGLSDRCGVLDVALRAWALSCRGLGAGAGCGLL